jgi:magnesium transporter
VNGETQVTDEFMDRLVRLEALLEAKDDGGIRGMLEALHPSDIADLVEELDEPERVHILDLLPAELASETLAEMEAEEHPEEILASLEPERISELIAELADDDAADLIGDLPPEEQTRILGTLTPVDAGELRQLLEYPEESAGGIMTTEAVVVSVHLTAQQAITEVRRQARDIGPEFYSVFVVDLMRRLIGLVSIQDLALADPDTPLRRLAVPPAAVVPVDMDQEDVGRLIARYNVPSLPVVGPDNVLLGRVTFDDVIDVMEAEQTEDILRLAGLGAEEELRGRWYEAVRSRLPWLFVNLLTAVAAAFVVWIFQATISQIVILAVIMPVIAGMGGNAGTQALAVTVRRLALSEGGLPQWEVVGKEMLVGLVNGAVLGVVVGVAGYALEGNATLGLVVLMAMWGNLLIASFAGGFVPILLERVGVDPAVASSIFVTTFTDLAGFFLLLGLATAMML